MHFLKVFRILYFKYFKKVSFTILKKRMVKVLVWRLVLYGSETLTLRQENIRDVSYTFISTSGKFRAEASRKFTATIC